LLRSEDLLLVIEFIPDGAADFACKFRKPVGLLLAECPSLGHKAKWLLIYSRSIPNKEKKRGLFIKAVYIALSEARRTLA